MDSEMERKVAQTELDPEEYSALAATAKKNKLTIKEALRKAFDATMADPEFLAEARQRGLEVNPVSGAAIDKLVDELHETAPDIIAEVRAAISEGAR